LSLHYPNQQDCNASAATSPPSLGGAATGQRRLSMAAGVAEPASMSARAADKGSDHRLSSRPAGTWFKILAATQRRARVPRRAAADAAGQVIDTLGSLVDASLVRDRDRSGQPRLSMLETIRDYSRVRLRESDQWKEAHDPACRPFPGTRRLRQGRAGGSQPGGLAGAAGSRARQPGGRDVLGGSGGSAATPRNLPATSR
jgi:hypothetical protein